MTNGLYCGFSIDSTDRYGLNVCGFEAAGAILNVRKRVVILGLKLKVRITGLELWIINQQFEYDIEAIG